MMVFHFMTKTIGDETHSLSLAGSKCFGGENQVTQIVVIFRGRNKKPAEAGLLYYCIEAFTSAEQLHH
jgi:hypothetical protein